jgi:hypothetical protein
MYWFNTPEAFCLEIAAILHADAEKDEVQKPGDKESCSCGCGEAGCSLMLFPNLSVGFGKITL